MNELTKEQEDYLLEEYLENKMYDKENSQYKENSIALLEEQPEVKTMFDNWIFWVMIGFSSIVFSGYLIYIGWTHKFFLSYGGVLARTGFTAIFGFIILIAVLIMFFAIEERFNKTK